ncbi:hypothetical protein FFWV33_02895 [Flavobacterium faecale]|uniref:Ig-like domain-containing protein n=1 Tax=Flavobacterium faecale TaxID=1355330 RepID=A0A2S1L9Z1_9FLAO|nr:hypothetical protein [Flavobacterium faecale]AWG20552.1 hypothetical protein FFWV33_02895 [Flavobacterium faecale]
MKNIKIRILLTILCINNSFAQVTTSITDVYVNSVTYNNCSLIDFGTTSNNNTTIYYKLTKPSNQAIGIGTLKILLKNDSSSYGNTKGSITISSESWANNTEYIGTIACNISQSEIQVTGSSILIEFTTDSNLKTRSCEYSLKKTQVPTFTLPVTTKTIDCGATTPQTFAITNVYNSPNTTYQWSTSGWKYNGNSVGTFTTTASSISLTPNATLPSNVTVTPIVNGVAYPSKTITVSLATFNPYVLISGSNGLCASNGSGIYTLENVPPNSSVYGVLQILV